MSITEQNICDAYVRTTGHPADSRVRLTSDENDVLALHYPGVKGVVYERPMPAEIMSWLKTTQSTNSSYTRPQTRVNEANKVEVLNWAEHTPMALQNDTVFLLQIFQNAAQNSNVKCDVSPEINKQSLSGEFSYRALAENTTTVIQPHFDGQAISVRALTSYTEDSDLNTIWFPGDLSESDLELIHIEMQHNYDEAFKKFNAQIVPLGHILLIKAKGYMSPLSPAEKALASHVDPAELLGHSKPMPKEGGLRYTNVYP